MDSARRLKAALVPKGVFLGDMTNSIVSRGVPLDYLLGVLNSRLLNWRFKLTSTNNYISARELESLPVPIIDFSAVDDSSVQEFVDAVRKDLSDREFSLIETVEVIDAKIRLHENSAIPSLLGGAIQRIVRELQSIVGCGERKRTASIGKTIDGLDRCGSPWTFTASCILESA